MARKKVKKTRKKVAKLTENEKEELKVEGELPKKSVMERENRQLIWFFVIVGVIFVSFLAPYFWIESTKVFEYGTVDWVVEEYAEPTGTIYHGRFKALNGADLFFNIFLRGDPRENDVRTEGTFSDFRYGGVISFSPEVDACRGELSRTMSDLSAFLGTGVGVGPLEIGSTDEVVANESGRRYGRCDNINDRTVVVIELGEPAVIQDEENPYCYTIYAEDCNGMAAVEKFMLKTVVDSNEVM